MLPTATLNNSLWYVTAAAAAAALGASDAAAQVVYVDVSPDVTLSDAAFEIDIDDDGDPEFALAHRWLARIYKDYLRQPHDAKRHWEAYRRLSGATGEK